MDNTIELKKILMDSTPILFVGAGFSYGSENITGKLPTGSGLKKDILDNFIVDKFTGDELKEIEGYELSDLCQFIDDSLKQKKELRAYITSRFIDSKPCSFHLWLNTYPWKRIYSVNVDDLIENIYSQNGKELTVQNTSRQKELVENSTELFKLHGCVHAPDEGLVFSRSEYTNLTTKRNYKLGSLTTDMLNQNFIFVGASLDESDIDHYVTAYEQAGYILRKGKMVFIDPYPTLKLKSRIEAMGGVLIEWTTERFLQFLFGLKYNPTKVESCKKELNYVGFFNYRDILAMNSDDNVYESRLYEGYPCKWRDVIDEWVCDTTIIQNIKKRCDDLDIGIGKAYCLSIYGNRFTGKACAIKEVGAYLNKLGYEVIEFKGKYFDPKVLQRYIIRYAQERVVLLIHNASFYYKTIEKLLKWDWGEKRLLIVTTSRRYYHNKKRYYLEGNPFEEIELKDRINKQDATIIYKKLLEKGYTGNLPKTEKESIPKIIKEGSLINLFSDISYGGGFRNRLEVTTSNVLNGADDICNLFLDLLIFDKADLEYYPSELLVQQYSIDWGIFCERDSRPVSKAQIYLVDMLTLNDNGLVLKNRLFVDMLWKRFSKKKVMEELYVLLVAISSRVSEYSDSYWRIIFESLLKEEVLSKVFGFKSQNILELYYMLKDNYYDISYFWLQLGIAEQKKKDYSKALNHLNMAHKIRPKAYQIQHAIARNYLKNANDESNIDLAQNLFSIGETKLLDLINSRENYKEKAKNFSIHCYVHEKTRFYKTHPELIDKDECKKMKRFIERLYKGDNYYAVELAKEFMELLKDNGLLDILTMQPGDPFFIALNDKLKIKYSLDDADPLIDTY